ncbi:MAG: hypothetical protein JWR69_3039 [Pedosphaera sp.]|nr:hypothetical protein [Pedosphaera sp.]
MKKFYVSVMVPVSATVEVEAKTAKQAEKKAEKMHFAHTALTLRPGAYKPEMIHQGLALEKP